ncbi:MAG: carbohydrate ABC transporter permease [Anaerolineae bacterium]|nr:carbohydrate ABC transporter permease [Anaerolineae bacterium]
MKPKMGKHVMRQRVMRHLAAGLLSLLFGLPLYWAVVASLGPVGAPPATTVAWWPRAAQWGNYVEIFRVVPLARYLVNSLIVVGVAVPVTLVTAVLAGFAMAQLPDPARRGVFIFNVVVLLVPGMAVWMFRYQVLQWLGLFDSLWSLIVPAFAASNPLFVLLFYWTFWRVPAEIYEAARLDGASALRVLWDIARPTAYPTFAGVAILTFVFYWSDFVSPVLYVYRPKIYTLAVGLQILKQLDATNWPLLMAAAVFMTVPVIGLFIVLQRFFLHDLALGKLLERN